MELSGSNERLTYANYLEWDESKRAEIIDGKLYDMASPTPAHQMILGELLGQIRDFLKGKPCKVISARLAVRLFEKDGDSPKDVDTVVEPDIMVVCDRNKFDERGIKGAPDLIIEILSPWNERHDIIVKYDLYERAGVREYWIVDPKAEDVKVFLLDEKGFLKPTEYYSADDTAKITVLNDCPIDLKAVFKAKEF